MTDAFAARSGRGRIRQTGSDSCLVRRMRNGL